MRVSNATIVQSFNFDDSNVALFHSGKSKYLRGLVFRCNYFIDRDINKNQDCYL